jgi:hypothetical protein
MTLADWLSKPWRRTFLVALPVALILATTATPSEGTGRDTPLSCLLCPPVGQRAGVDFMLNVLLYIPLGFALTRARTPPLAALLAAGLLSAAIEALQLEIIDGRIASTLDVVTNVLGAGLGILLASRLRALLAPSARAAAALAIVAGGFWMGTVAATAWLLRPAIPTEGVIVRLTPRPRARATGAAELIDAALGGRTLPAGRVEWRTGDRELFVSGVAPLRLRLIPNPRLEGPDPRLQLLASDGERRLLVGQSGNDLIFQVKRHANDLRLRSPGLRLPNFVAAGAHDTVRLVARLRGAGLALTAETGRRTEGAELRLGALAGWSLIFYRGGHLRNIALQLLWSGVILLPLGYWASRSAGSGLPRGAVRDHRRVLTSLLTIALTLAGGVVVVPLAFGYPLPSAWELTTVLTALMGGLWAATIAPREWRAQGGAAARRPTDLASRR